MLADIAAGTPVPSLNHGLISVRGPSSFIKSQDQFSAWGKFGKTQSTQVSNLQSAQLWGRAGLLLKFNKITMLSTRSNTYKSSREAATCGTQWDAGESTASCIHSTLNTGDAQIHVAWRNELLRNKHEGELKTCEQLPCGLFTACVVRARPCQDANSHNRIHMLVGLDKLMKIPPEIYVGKLVTEKSCCLRQ